MDLLIKLAFQRCSSSFETGIDAAILSRVEMVFTVFIEYEHFARWIASFLVQTDY